MSCAASVKLFFGVCYEYDSPDGVRIGDEINLIDLKTRDGADWPAALVYNGTTADGIAVVPYRHLDVTSYGLAIAESVVVKDWAPLSLHESQRLVQFGWIDRIITYANKHGLTIDAETRFGYWIVPYYG